MTTIDDLPDRQVRARAPMSGESPAKLMIAPAPPLPEDAQIVCLGSRLAPALGAVLETRGYRRIRTDTTHPALPPIEPEAEEYASYGTLAGPTGNSTAIEQLLRRCLGEFRPAEDRWPQGDVIVDPFRPGLRYPARSDREFDVLGERFLTGLRSALRRAQAVVIALDTIEICEAVADGAVLPVWPARIDSDRYRIRALGAKEIGDQLQVAVETLRRINPAIHVLLMVSPEPIPATHAPRHVLLADMLAKATLRVAVERVSNAEGVFYVPALELAWAMQVPAELAVTNAAFLSALGEAVISAEIDASKPDVAPLQDEPEPQAEKKKVRGRRTGAATPPTDASAPDAPAPTPTEEPVAETKSRGRRARAATAGKVPKAASAAPKRGTATGEARRARRVARNEAKEADTPAKKAPVIAVPVDQSGYKEPGRKRGKRAKANTEAAKDSKAAPRRRAKRDKDG
ncbi:GSCFA domain-containing protein [Sphingomonas sp.]|uniref:GSCFA domain-containing protein n=1 Tax=Sphingomonas sp. TaxID=28214 RepID=UPI0035C85FAA